MQASEACLADRQLKPETTTKEEVAARKRKRLLGMIPYPLMSEALRQNCADNFRASPEGNQRALPWLKYNDSEVGGGRMKLNRRLSEIARYSFR